MLKPRTIFVVCVLTAFVLSPPVWAAKKKAKKYTPTAKSAILSNSTKGQRLYSKNANTRVAPASTTKVMTALLAMEHLPLDKVVTASQNATLVQPSEINIVAGERYRVCDLLYASLMQSANDASVVLAEAVSGSEEKFVKLMNQRAWRLGAFGTKFANAHGLPTKESQYTTAYDMYLIFKEALKYPFFREALPHRYKTIYSQEGRKIFLKSHNKLLWKDWKKKIYGKTGYTKKAQSCFVGYFKKGKDTFIVAVFGCTKRWSDIKYILNRYGAVGL